MMNECSCSEGFKLDMLPLDTWGATWFNFKRADHSGTEAVMSQFLRLREAQRAAAVNFGLRGWGDGSSGISLWASPPGGWSPSCRTSCILNRGRGLSVGCVQLIRLLDICCIKGEDNAEVDAFSWARAAKHMYFCFTVFQLLLQICIWWTHLPCFKLSFIHSFPTAYPVRGHFQNFGGVKPYKMDICFKLSHYRDGS